MRECEGKHMGEKLTIGEDMGEREHSADKERAQTSNERRGYSIGQLPSPWEKIAP